MRILFLECKKIMNWKLLLIIALFSVFFQRTYMDWYYYPASASGEADILLSAELMEEYGPDMEMSEWGEALKEKQKLTVERLDRAVRENAVFQKHKIGSWKELKRVGNELFDIYDEDKDMKPENAGLVQAIDDFNFVTHYKDVFRKQTIDGFQEELNAEWRSFGFEEEQLDFLIEDRYGGEKGGISEDFKERASELLLNKRVSLLPENAFDYIRYQMAVFGILLLISCMVLTLPYQIRERLSGVKGLCLTTATGRSLLCRQFFSILLMSSLICFVQTGIYLVILWKKGILAFAACPAVTHTASIALWFDINFGVYIGIYLLLNWLYALTGTMLLYFISQKAANYMIGFAAALPLVIGIGMLYVQKAANLFAFYPECGMGKSRMVQALFPAVAVVLLFLLAAGASWAGYLRNRKKDMLV
ncbi:MAG: hypothetical protein Q4F21_03320 [Lachnospiraceae bacterium]|nr:hypothetical protein [Lachnospiraceae bacterium]